MARGGQPSSTGEVQASTLAVLGEQRVVGSTNIFLLSGYEGILTVDSSVFGTKSNSSKLYLSIQHEQAHSHETNIHEHNSYCQKSTSVKFGIPGFLSVFKIEYAGQHGQ
jgi:hypothetical protein